MLLNILGWDCFYSCHLFSFFELSYAVTSDNLLVFDQYRTSSFGSCQKFGQSRQVMERSSPKSLVSRSSLLHSVHCIVTSSSNHFLRMCSGRLIDSPSRLPRAAFQNRTILWLAVVILVHGIRKRIETRFGTDEE